MFDDDDIFPFHRGDASCFCFALENVLFKFGKFKSDNRQLGFLVTAMV